VMHKFVSYWGKTRRARRVATTVNVDPKGELDMHCNIVRPGLVSDPEPLQSRAWRRYPALIIDPARSAKRRRG
jgi:hypothetical protein